MKNYINKITQCKWTGIALAAVGILMMAFGIYRGEMEVVFTKAVNTVSYTHLTLPTKA